ncbi:MAG TPA: sodium/solute symporter [Lacipirellulaceae bacterium]|nr:sodium/solute symporter [Lacipirellulaceae bacterium]
MGTVGVVDILVFVAFVTAVIAVGLLKSREQDGEKDAQDYFLAGRGLTWWLVGFSLIAANISTEQFVGMSGKAADWLGMAIASYEWLAAITLTVVAFVFLPKFLRTGIYTIPEFLEYRFGPFARTFMALATMIILVTVPTASVIYSGAKVISVFFQGQELLGLDLGSISVGCWIIGTLAAVYVFAGGLKACAWADLIQGAALILGGLILACLVMQRLGTADPDALIATSRNKELTAADLVEKGPVQRFIALNDAPLPEGKLHMKRPLDDREIPWTALALGLWIPNFFYWGLNQYITQRTLGSKSLAEGQKGIVFAAFLKLLIPFVVVVPGILAFNLFNADLRGAATVKNARTLAAYAPQLYEELSGAIKPDPDNPLYRNDLKSIDRFLQQGAAREGSDVQLFRFTQTFAEDHADDAAKILAHNRAAAGIETDGVENDSPFSANQSLLRQAADDPRGTVNELVLRDYDAAFPVLLKNLLPAGTGVLGFVLAAIFGAVVSSLASMLNSASTIAAMDLYRKARPGATSRELVSVGRFFVVVFVLWAILFAPALDDPALGGIFTYIQEFQGFISPGVLAVFLFGLLVHRAPRKCGAVGLLLSPVLYGAFKFAPRIPGLSRIPGLVTTAPMEAAGLKGIADWSFLVRMSLTFLIVLAVLTAMRLLRPLAAPVELPFNDKINLESSPTAKFFGAVVIALTVVLYVVFW